ncbi:MAG: efflux RND transporter periplasmic adaptor subunit [Psychrobium sp.]|nr:efflux RND transporter periplasmic adaptor subunit [Psychrobium sp.]
MATKKQIVFPLIALTVAIAGAGILVSMKKAPEEKIVVEYVPLVKVENLLVGQLQLTVDSQGLVSEKQRTQIVAQVSGQVIELAQQFVQGGMVRKGDLLVRIDPSDYQANLIEAQANLASARASLQREKAQGHVAEKEWQQITNSTPSQLGLRKPQLAQEVARMRAAQALVTKAKRNLERTYIRAPYDAIISSRDIGLGSIVGNGSSLGLLLATDVAQVRLPIADKDLQFLPQQGLGAKVTLHAQYNGQATQWQGIIVRNEGVIDRQSRMNYLVVEVKTPYQLANPLQFGNYVTAKIDGFVLPNAALVPRHLVSNNRLAMFSSDRKLAFKAITVVRQQGKYMVVTGQLSNDNQYIVSALDYPIVGMKLGLANELLEQPAVDDNSKTLLAISEQEKSPKASTSNEVGE